MSRGGAVSSGLKKHVTSPAVSRASQIQAHVHQHLDHTGSTAAAAAAARTRSAESKSLLSTSTHKRKANVMESSLNPLEGFYKPNELKGLYYGSGTVKSHLLSCLPSDKSKAFIITGNSLATKTPLVKQVEELLQSRSAHAGTFSQIKQHAPVADLDQAADQVFADSTIDTIISIGGGSPIDSAKAISHRFHERSESKAFLNHITIPTTLSAAECTFIAGYTGEDGVKTSVVHPQLFPSWVLYDSQFALHTPPTLFASTGIRALDHAIEIQYYPTATLMPAQYITLGAAQQLFQYLPQYHLDPKNEQTILRLYLAAYASLGFLGANLKGGLGLSHTLGYALGSPYGIPHGITSCLTLGHVVKIKAETSPDDAAAMARVLTALGGQRSGNDVRDAEVVGDKILGLVSGLGLNTTLTEKGVGRDQVDLIVQRCGGGKLSKEVEDKVRNLVQSLY